MAEKTKAVELLAKIELLSMSIQQEVATLKEVVAALPAGGLPKGTNKVIVPEERRLEDDVSSDASTIPPPGVVEDTLPSERDQGSAVHGHTKSPEPVVDDKGFIKFEGVRTPAQVELAVLEITNARLYRGSAVEKNRPRTREHRAQLVGHDCPECRSFLRDEPDASRRAILLRHSRHRAEKAPPQTPPGYWDLSFPETETQPPPGYEGDEEIEKD